jgi:hypothetical protein
MLRSLARRTGAGGNAWRGVCVMATATEQKSAEKYVDFAEYVDYQLQKARRQIKSTDLLTAATVAAVMTLAYLLLFVICDHWLVPGGIPAWARWVGLVLWLAGLLVWLSCKLFWPWFRSVTGLFAAKEVERSEPAFRSNLLNWVDLQRAKRPVDPAVLRAIERQAAVQLTKIDVGQAIDHRPLLRSGYALLATVALFCLYSVLSPKNVGPSLWRVLPLTDVPVPTRTEIREVQPGDARVLSRSVLEVTVELGGVIPPEVKLLYTTDDLKFQDEPLSLKPTLEGSTRYRGLLTGEPGQGLLRSLHYRIVAGDAVSRDYRVEIEHPPSAKVQQVRIVAPPYTRLPEEIVAGGNFSAWEGSRVEITAAANMPVHAAVLQFLDEPQGKPTGEEERVRVTEGTQLEATWTLQFRANGTFPRYYRLQCETADGRKDPAPLVYQYDIQKDQPPEIVLLAPEGDLAVPANAVVPILADARDPDFELGPVTLHLEREGQNLFRDTLFTGGKASTRVEYDLALAALNLRPGDELALYLEAQDNRQPRRNRRQSRPVRIRIEAPVSPQRVQEQLAEAKQRQQQLAEARPVEQPRPPAEATPPQDTPQDAEASRPPAERRAGRDDDPTQHGETARTADAPEPQSTSRAASPANAPAQGESSPEADGSEKASPAGTSERPLSPDGEDDQELLRRLHDKLLGDQRQTAENTDDRSAGTPKSSAAKTPQPGSSGAERTAQPATPPSDAEAPRNGTDSPRPTEKPARPDPNRQTSASEPEERGSAPPTNRAEGNEPPSGEPLRPTPALKPEKSGEATVRSPDDSAPPPEAQQQRSESSRPSDTSPSASNGREATAKPEQLKPADSPAAQPRSETAESQRRKPEQTEATKRPPADTAPHPPGDTSKAPNASSQPALPKGTPEQGAASPDSDPTASQPGKTASQAREKPATDDPAAGEPAADRQAGSEKAPPPTGSQRSEGQPSGADEPAMGPGRKDGQRSDQPQTGEQGGSQQSRSGNAGGQQAGPGQTVDRAGDRGTGSSSASPSSSKTATSPSGGQQSNRTGNQPGGPNDGTSPAGKPSADSQSGGEQSGGQQAGGQQSGRQQPGSDNLPGERPAGTPASASPDGASKTESAGPNQSPSVQEGAQRSQGKPEAAAAGASPAKAGEASPAPASGTQEEQAANERGSQPPSANDANSSPSDEAPKGSGGQKPSEGQRAGSNQPGGGGQSSEGASQGGQAGSRGQATSGEGGEGKPGRGDRASGSVGKGGSASGETGPSEAQVGHGDPDSSPEGDAAVAEFNRQAAELILQRLQKNLERGDIDPALLEELGWTEAEMRRFVERLGKQLQRDADDSPEAEARRLQFEEMLKSLDLRRTGAKRAAGEVPKRSVEQVDSRRSVAPAEYRKAWETYTRKLLEQNKAPAK